MRNQSHLSSETSKAILGSSGCRPRMKTPGFLATLGAGAALHTQRGAWPLRVHTSDLPETTEAAPSSTGTPTPDVESVLPAAWEPPQSDLDPDPCPSRAI